MDLCQEMNRLEDGDEYFADFWYNEKQECILNSGQAEYV